MSAEAQPHDGSITPAAQHPLTRAVRTALRQDATAFAYSTLVTTVYAVVAHLAGPPSPTRIALYAGGAVSAFASLEAVASRGFRIGARGEPSDVVFLGTAMSFASVGAGLAVATGIATLWPSPSWFVAPFVATILYVTIAGAQLALARRRQEREESR